MRGSAIRAEWPFSWLVAGFRLWLEDEMLARFVTKIRVLNGVWQTEI